MAKKKSAEGEKKKVSKKGRRRKDTIITPSSIVMSLNPEEQAQLEQCLANSGEVKITFREIRVTQLPKTLDNGRQID